MRRTILAVSVGAVVAAAGIGIGVANAAVGSAPAAQPAGTTTTTANSAVTTSNGITIPESTVRQRRANETKDGDPRNPAAWGPAQAESAQVAARGAYDRAGVTTWVAAQREGTTDRYQITLKAQKGGGQYQVEVDYLTFSVVSVSPLS